MKERVCVTTGMMTVGFRKRVHLGSWGQKRRIKYFCQANLFFAALVPNTQTKHPKNVPKT
jgi:hypothetical protein